MKLPRDLNGEDLAKLLVQFGYSKVRQTGSHMRLSTSLKGEHHITIPKHKILSVGILSAILSDVAEHLKMTKNELIQIITEEK